MYQPPGVKTSPDLPIPDLMAAWVLGDPDQLLLREKPTPIPWAAVKYPPWGVQGGNTQVSRDTTSTST